MLRREVQQKIDAIPSYVVGVGYASGRPHQLGSPDADHDYTPDELEFMFALDYYKRSKGRRFPAWCEVLAVAKALGYRKVEEG